MLKLTELVGITIFLLYKQKKKNKTKQKKNKNKKQQQQQQQQPRWNSDIQNFYSEIFNFRLFFAKNRNFQVRHVFMTS